MIDFYACHQAKFYCFIEFESVTHIKDFTGERATKWSVKFLRLHFLLPRPKLENTTKLRRAPYARAQICKISAPPSPYLCVGLQPIFAQTLPAKLGSSFPVLSLNIFSPTVFVCKA